MVCVLLYNRNILITKTGHFWNCVKLKDQLPGRTEGGMVRGNTESSHYYGDYNAAAVQVVRGCYYSNSVQPPTTQTLLVPLL